MMFVVEMNCCFNAQRLMRQRARELLWEAAPLVWSDVWSMAAKTATTSCKPSTEGLGENHQQCTNASTGNAGGLRSR